jgi:hypothetical protein
LKHWRRKQQVQIRYAEYGTELPSTLDGPLSGYFEIAAADVVQWPLSFG